MRYKISAAELDPRERPEVTVWRPDGTGQSGVLVSFTPITVEGPNGRTHMFAPDEVESFAVERPGDPEDCIDFHYDSARCKGDVEYRWTGKTDRLRCEFHGDRILRLHEETMQRYPDSPVPPADFDPSYAGERWDDDY